MSAARKLVGPMEPLEVVTLVIDGGVAHVLQSQHPFGQKDVATADGIGLSKRLFFDHPVAAVFTPDDVPGVTKHVLFNAKFSQANEKKGLLHSIDQILNEQIKSLSLRADIITIADEMITNAVYNAPFVDLDNTSSGTSRTSSNVTMGEGKTGQMWVASDEERLLVLCEDDYGTLNPLKMFERIRKCYATSVAESMNMEGTGGAGIGSFMMFNASVSFFVGVEKGKKTIIGCILPRKGSGKSRAQMVKNLHFIFSN